jgi:hypothetical protein
MTIKKTAASNAVVETAIGEAHDAEAVAYQNHPEHPASPGVSRDKTGPVAGTAALDVVDVHATGQVIHLANEPTEKVTGLEILSGVLALACWMGFFATGLFVPAATYRLALWDHSTELGWLTRTSYCAIAVCAYTVTNLLFLCCLASFLGCMTCRWGVRDGQLGGSGISIRVPAARMYLSAALRGFFLYVLVVSGLLVLTNEAAVIDTGFAQYIRLAGFTSGLAFVIGYDPNLISVLMSKVTDIANRPLQPREDAGGRSGKGK